MLALLVATAGCTTIVRSTDTAFYPHSGIHLLYSRDGRLIQKTIWRHDALVAAWEYQRKGDLPRGVIDAVKRGERDWPSPRWIQVVWKGTGRLGYLDGNGEDTGFADFREGQYLRGAN